MSDANVIDSGSMNDVIVVGAGLSGVITAPIEGAKEQGVAGMLKGVGRGAVGLFVKPIAGGLDWGEVSNLLRGPGWVYEAIIIAYTLFTTFAVVNYDDQKNVMMITINDEDDVMMLTIS